MARYEALIINGANGATETVQLESTNCLGGYFCRMDMVSHYLDNGLVCAIVRDNQKGDTFYLANIEW